MALTRCELLSKIIIFVTRHNARAWKPAPWTVVNCFQKLLSSWHDTTAYIFRHQAWPLWIAFKNYYLRDTTQHIKANIETKAGCELLSKIIIFVTRHNKKGWYCTRIRVVNCFQKLLSSWHDTTMEQNRPNRSLLWIAFKNYYLRDTTQQKGHCWYIARSCELLSKIIIFVTRHNSQKIAIAIKVVVNCFQKLLSSWHDTTIPL